ncbi:MAG: hypothetical protein V4726_07545 [Verrucomicrobiota bacterium]
MSRTVRLLPGPAAALCLALLPGCQATKPAGEAADPASPGGVKRSPQEQAFLIKCAEMGKSPGTVAGRDGWFFASTELLRLSSLTDPASPSVRAATAAISDYRDQLQREGTELVFVPVPPKAVIFPDKLSKDLKIKMRGKKPERFDSTLQEAYEALRKKGVRVIDLTEPLLAARDDRKLGPAFTRTSTVWSPRGAEIAAAAISKEFKDAKWARDGKTGPLITEAATVSFTGSLAIGKVPPESLPVRNIGRSADGKMSSVTFSQGGHALAIIGDETVLAWREANNPQGSSSTFASLADQLAFELQTTPDLFPGNADGRNSARMKILREGTNGARPLGSAKVVLWVIEATDLAVTDWKKVPLRLDFNVSQPELQLTPAAGASPVPARPAAETVIPSAPAPDPAATEPDPTTSGVPPLPR